VNIDPTLIEQAALRLTVALSHLLWQGLVIALVASARAFAARKRPASWRYALHTAALLLMAACLPLNLTLAPAPSVDSFAATPARASNSIQTRSIQAPYLPSAWRPLRQRSRLSRIKTPR
jgi:hypothetical protein